MRKEARKNVRLAEHDIYNAQPHIARPIKGNADMIRSAASVRNDRLPQSSTLTLPFRTEKMETRRFVKFPLWSSYMISAHRPMYFSILAADI
jgi:hypothetical protein